MAVVIRNQSGSRIVPKQVERALGFKRFSDVLKALEKEKILEVEMDEQKTMLIKVP